MRKPMVIVAAVLLLASCVTITRDTAQLELGMTRGQVVAIWGKPIRINTTVVRGLKAEQWVYYEGTYGVIGTSSHPVYLYFDNGLLTGWQN